MKPNAARGRGRDVYDYIGMFRCPLLVAPYLHVFVCCKYCMTSVFERALAEVAPKLSYDNTVVVTRACSSMYCNRLDMIWIQLI